MIKTYYSLTKPGIIYGNALTAAAGFLLASKGHIDIGLMLATLAGICLVIASACVINNYIDRGIDAKMARTKQRALVSGLVPVQRAIIFAAVLGGLGFLVLGLFVNFLTVCIGLVAIVDYVILYGVSKRRSVHGTLVGSVSGAAPIVAGYTAAAGRFDLGTLILFIILVLWQMPHFYAIAIYRLKDYRAAGLPVLPVKKGIKPAKIQILIYIVAFIVANAALSAFGYTGYSYLGVMTLLGLVWLWRGLGGYAAARDEKWARGMFFFSLIIILALSLMLALNSLLP